MVKYEDRVPHHNQVNQVKQIMNHGFIFLLLIQRYYVYPKFISELAIPTMPANIYCPYRDWNADAVGKNQNFWAGAYCEVRGSEESLASRLAQDPHGTSRWAGRHCNPILHNNDICRVSIHPSLLSKDARYQREVEQSTQSNPSTKGRKSNLLMMILDLKRDNIHRISPWK